MRVDRFQKNRRSQFPAQHRNPDKKSFRAGLLQNENGCAHPGYSKNLCGMVPAALQASEFNPAFATGRFQPLSKLHKVFQVESSGLEILIVAHP
jgi:hypothetical protein